jgi:hypothetical protein
VAEGPVDGEEARPETSPGSGESLRERLSRLLRSRPAGRLAPPAGTRRDLPSLLPGEETVGPRGAFWLGRWDFDERPLVAGDVARGLAARAVPDGGLLLLDLETTGFAGTPLFLAGLIAVGGGIPHLEQLFARDYSEEAAVIEAIAARRARRPPLGTFNGKSYDLPFLRDRAACSRIALPEPAGHVDLLHAARRRWRDVLPDCRLTTVEAHIGGAARIGDLPGREIPARYHDAVRRGDPSGLASVFLHNALDLVTLARLYLALDGGAREGT